MESDLELCDWPDCGAFLDRAGAFLEASPAEHQLLLSLAERHRGGGAVVLKTAERGGEVVGAALRTPPHNWIISRMPAEVARRLGEETAGDGAPGVMGRSALAKAFADGRGGGEQTFGHAIYQLGALVPPGAPPPGAMRVAEAADFEQVWDWVQRFTEETGSTIPASRERTEQVLAAGDLVLWDDGAPRALAGVAGRSTSTARVAYVYTPASSRGRGLASALVAALSAKLRADGQECMLFADLANPTSNKIYQAIGYELVCDVVIVGLRA